MLPTIKVKMNKYNKQVNDIWMHQTTILNTTCNPLNDFGTRTDADSFTRIRNFFGASSYTLLPAISPDLKEKSASTILVNSIQGFLEKYYPKKLDSEAITQPYDFILYIIEYSLRNIQILDLTANKKITQYEVLIKVCMSFLERSEIFYEAVPIYQNNKNVMMQDFDRLIKIIKCELDNEIKRLQKEFKSRQLAISLDELQPLLVTILRDFPLALLKFIFDKKIPADFLDTGYLDRNLLGCEEINYEQFYHQAHTTTKMIINNKHKFKLLRQKIYAGIQYEDILRSGKDDILEEETLKYLKKVSLKYSDKKMFIKSLPKIIYQTKNIRNKSMDIQKEINSYVVFLEKLFDIYQKLSNLYRSHTAIKLLCDNWGNVSKIIYFNRIKKYSEDARSIFSGILTALHSLEKSSGSLISFIPKLGVSNWSCNVKNGIIKIHEIANAINKEIYPRLDLINQSLTEEWIQGDLTEMSDVIKKLDMYTIIGACLDLSHVQGCDHNTSCNYADSSHRTLEIHINQSHLMNNDARVGSHMISDSLDKSSQKKLKLLALRRDIYILKDELRAKKKLMYKLDDSNSLSYKFITPQWWWLIVWATGAGFVMHIAMIMSVAIYRRLDQDKRIAISREHQKYMEEIKNIELTIATLKKCLANRDDKKVEKNQQNLSSLEAISVSEKSNNKPRYRNLFVLWNKNLVTVKNESPALLSRTCGRGKN